LRILNVVDEAHPPLHRFARGSRSAPATSPAFSASSPRPHGRPRLLRSDNGREFIAASLAKWLADRGVAQAFIEKGMPPQNAYVERFNGTMRDEVLNGESFRLVLEAQVVISTWVEEYDTAPAPRPGLPNTGRVL
jgi:transposase InsO family protein